MMEATLEKTGWDTFIIRNESGLAKTSVRCSLCKQLWFEYHQTTKDRGKVFLASSDIGVAHVETCEKLLDKLNRRLAYMLQTGWVNRSRDAESYQVRALYITYKLFNWKDRGDGGHECSAKCQSAKGPTCECKCQGMNHGGH